MGHDGSAPDRRARRAIALTVDGRDVELDDSGDTLLGALRDQLGLTGAKDGCSPQGQCGCCTVLVDGQPRVACVTPLRRVRGRSITTIDGLDDERAQAWGQAFCDTGGSQCGFCTPGIVLRLDALRSKQIEADASLDDHGPVENALLAHLCRCTGWQTILEAWDRFDDAGEPDPDRDLAAAGERATIEGRAIQAVSPAVALGRGGFAADTVPDDALVAVAGNGEWHVGETTAQAREAAGKVQGRRTTVEHSWPIEVPDGAFDATMRTTWVEPAYLETDAAWCEPGGDPASPLANGGAFGAKRSTPIGEVARQLADEHQRPVLALASREDTVRLGPKRPPIAGGANADGTGVIRVASTPGIAEAIASVAPGLVVEEVDVVGPPTSADVRAAGWAEAIVLLAGARGEAGQITSPDGAVAEATIVAVDGTPTIEVAVSCGRVLDEVVLRSYCIGAAHMAWSWLTSEALTIDDDGEIHDLTVRSFGVLRAVDTPSITVTIDHDDEREPCNGSDAVFAAVAAAGWVAADGRQDWPVGDIMTP